MNAITTRSLYRSCLREVTRLPYAYLRTFFRLKFRDDFTSLLATQPTVNDIRSVKLRRIGRELKKLREANDGNKKAFIRVLDTAYGRRGKLKSELLEPFLCSSVEKPPPLIPGVEKSRPPVYGPELTALHISPVSRRTKPLDVKSLAHPPTLSPRADPSSEEARLLGPLSKRLEVNTRWRFFANEAKKLYPPLHVETEIHSPRSEKDDVLSSPAANEFMPAQGGFQDLGILEHLESLTRRIERPKTRREKRELMKKSPDTPKENSAKNPQVFPNRFLKRTHLALLKRIPKLTYRSKGPDKPGKFDVSMPSQGVTASRIPLIDDHNMIWLQRAKELKDLSK